MNKLTVIISVCIIVIVAAAVVMLVPPQPVNAPTQNNGEEPGQAVTSFAECIAAGYPVMESYPRQCNTPTNNFVEDIGNAIEKIDIIQALLPQPNAKITSPLVVEGEARGNWYFEASFPIEIQNAAGQVIGQGYAQAQGEWMTTEFVPFKSIDIAFPAQPAGSVGKVILRKDNPSGLPEHDDHLEIPVTF